MARLAPSYDVMTDVVNLGDLADIAKPIPNLAPPPWAKGDEPLYESIDLNELPNEALRMKVCRSFRADLRHKLTLIIRANGGYGNGGVTSAAARLGVKRVSIHRWITWRTTPRERYMWEKIDTAYEEAVHILTARKMKAQVKRARAVKTYQQKKLAERGKLAPCASL